MEVETLEKLLVVEKMDGTNLCLNLKYRYILTRSKIEGADEISEVRIFVPKNSTDLDHVASDVEFLTVTFNPDSGRSPMELFVKKQLRRKNCPLKLEKQMTTMLLKEGTFLMEFVPQMESFCMELLLQKKEMSNRPTQNFIGNLFPHTLFADEKLIIMENLAKHGFSACHNDKNLQNFSHAKLVLQNLAKFHAVTHLMIQRDGGRDKFLSRHPNFEDDMVNPDLIEFFSSAFESAFAVAVSILTDCPGSRGREEKVEILKNYQGTLQKKVTAIVSADSPLYVVCHGNCCNSNILFNNDDDGEEGDIIFVDFKTSRVGSPNLDIGYFLFRCVEANVRRLRWKELLKIYFEAFIHHVELGGNLNHNFTFQKFVDDFVHKSELGFLFAIFLLPGTAIKLDKDSQSEICEAIERLIEDYTVMKMEGCQI